MSIESPIFPEIRENEDFQVYRNLLARVSEETKFLVLLKVATQGTSYIAN